MTVTSQEQLLVISFSDLLFLNIGCSSSGQSVTLSSASRDVFVLFFFAVAIHVFKAVCAGLPPLKVLGGHEVGCCSLSIMVILLSVSSMIAFPFIFSSFASSARMASSNLKLLIVLGLLAS